MATGDFGRGKTIFILAVVIGCFAILWPKIFYPMLTASLNPSSEEGEQCCDVIFVKDTNAHKILNEICSNILRKESENLSLPAQETSKLKTTIPPKSPVVAANLCRNEILKTCGVDVVYLIKDNPAISKGYKESLSQLRAYNTSQCMKANYGVEFQEIGLPRKVRHDSQPSHMRPERPLNFRPDMMHPALREKGRAIHSPLPQRTIEKEARPGPMPGVRPPIGGSGHVATPKGGGTMGIIMPIYTIGIVVFFFYTIMKVFNILFRKSEDEKPECPVPVPVPPQLKDFGMNPEHRKYVFTEEYVDKSERSLKDQLSKPDRDLGIKRRPAGAKTRSGDARSRLENEPEQMAEQTIATETQYDINTRTSTESATSAPATDTSPGEASTLAWLNYELPGDSSSPAFQNEFLLPQPPPQPSPTPSSPAITSKPIESQPQPIKPTTARSTKALLEFKPKTQSLDISTKADPGIPTLTKARPLDLKSKTQSLDVISKTKPATPSLLQLPKTLESPPTSLKIKPVTDPQILEDFEALTADILPDDLDSIASSFDDIFRLSQSDLDSLRLSPLPSLSSTTTPVKSLTPEPEPVSTSQEISLPKPSPTVTTNTIDVLKPNLGVVNEPSSSLASDSLVKQVDNRNNELLNDILPVSATLVEETPNSIINPVEFTQEPETVSETTDVSELIEPPAFIPPEPAVVAMSPERISGESEEAKLAELLDSEIEGVLDTIKEAGEILADLVEEQNDKCHKSVLGVDAQDTRGKDIIDVEVPTTTETQNILQREMKEASAETKQPVIIIVDESSQTEQMYGSMLSPGRVEFEEIIDSPTDEITNVDTKISPPDVLPSELEKVISQEIPETTCESQKVEIDVSPPDLLSTDSDKVMNKEIPGEITIESQKVEREIEIPPVDSGKVLGQEIPLDSQNAQIETETSPVDSEKVLGQEIPVETTISENEKVENLKNINNIPQETNIIELCDKTEPEETSQEKANICATKDSSEIENQVVEDLEKPCNKITIQEDLGELVTIIQDQTDSETSVKDQLGDIESVSNETATNVDLVNKESQPDIIQNDPSSSLLVETPIGSLVEEQSKANAPEMSTDNLLVENIIPDILAESDSLQKKDIETAASIITSGIMEKALEIMSQAEQLNKSRIPIEATEADLLVTPTNVVNIQESACKIAGDIISDALSSCSKLDLINSEILSKDDSVNILEPNLLTSPIADDILTHYTKDDKAQLITEISNSSTPKGNTEEDGSNAGFGVINAVESAELIEIPTNSLISPLILEESSDSAVESFPSVVTTPDSPTIASLIAAAHGAFALPPEVGNIKVEEISPEQQQSESEEISGCVDEGPMIEIMPTIDETDEKPGETSIDEEPITSKSDTELTSSSISQNTVISAEMLPPPEETKQGQVSDQSSSSIIIPPAVEEIDAKITSQVENDVFVEIPASETTTEKIVDKTDTQVQIPIDQSIDNLILVAENASETAEKKEIPVISPEIQTPIIEIESLSLKDAVVEKSESEIPTVEKSQEEKPPEPIDQGAENLILAAEKVSETDEKTKIPVISQEIQTPIPETESVSLKEAIVEKSESEMLTVEKSQEESISEVKEKESIQESLIAPIPTVESVVESQSTSEVDLIDLIDSTIVAESSNVLADVSGEKQVEESSNIPSVEQKESESIEIPTEVGAVSEKPDEIIAEEQIVTKTQTVAVEEPKAEDIKAVLEPNLEIKESKESAEVLVVANLSPNETTEKSAAEEPIRDAAIETADQTPVETLETTEKVVDKNLVQEESISDTTLSNIKLDTPAQILPTETAEESAKPAEMVLEISSSTIESVQPSDIITSPVDKTVQSTESSLELSTPVLESVKPCETASKTLVVESGEKISKTSPEVDSSPTATTVTLSDTLVESQPVETTDLDKKLEIQEEIIKDSEAEIISPSVVPVAVDSKDLPQETEITDISAVASQDVLKIKPASPIEPDTITTSFEKDTISETTTTSAEKDTIPDTTTTTSVDKDTIPDTTISSTDKITEPDTTTTSIEKDTIPDTTTSVDKDTIPDITDSVEKDTIPDTIASVEKDTIPDTTTTSLEKDTILLEKVVGLGSSEAESGAEVSTTSSSEMKEVAPVLEEQSTEVESANIILAVIPKSVEIAAVELELVSPASGTSSSEETCKIPVDLVESSGALLTATATVAGDPSTASLDETAAGQVILVVENESETAGKTVLVELAGMDDEVVLVGEDANVDAEIMALTSDTDVESQVVVLEPTASDEFIDISTPRVIETESSGTTTVKEMPSSSLDGSSSSPVSSETKTDTQATSSTLTAVDKSSATCQDSCSTIDQAGAQDSKESGHRDRDARDIEIDMLRKRLEETEAAMERIVAQMGSVSDRISPTILAQVLKAQGVLKDELAKSPEQTSVPKSSIAEETPEQVQSQEGKAKKRVQIELPKKDQTSEEEEEEEEEESSSFARPPTPPRTVSIKPKQSAAAAIAAAKAAANSLGGGVSVVGFEESFALESGKKWHQERSPTPTNRVSSPISPSSPRPPTPPEDIPSIFLEGPMPASANQLLVSDPQIEIEGEEGDYDDDDYDSVSAPVILSGKVTLSVISGAADDITEPPSVSMDDHAKADRQPKAKQAHAASSKQSAASKNVQKSSKASSPDMDEYEVVVKGGFIDPDDDADLTHYSTATDAEADMGGDGTAADISQMDALEDGKQDDILDDDEGEEEEEEEEEEDEE